MNTTVSKGAFCLLFAASLAVAGCSSNVPDDAEEIDGKVTGVSDLAELEETLALTKDVQDEQGRWSRPDSKLTAGPCYQKTAGGPEAAAYEVRRYKNGAVVAEKKGAPYVGTRRPVSCVDVDDDDGETLELSGFKLDAAIRYRIGKPTGREGAAGSSYTSFSHGHIRYVSQFCQGYDENDPSQIGGKCLAEVKFPGSGEEPASLLALVYHYAWKDAVSKNRYSFKDDAFGRFVSSTAEHHGTLLSFEKLDARFVRAGDGGGSLLFILPKVRNDSSDKGSALVSCSYGTDNDPGVHCTGLGEK
jgi:hypothetical protein